MGEHEKDQTKKPAHPRDDLDDYALNEAMNLLKGMALQRPVKPGPTKTAQLDRKG